MAELSEFGVALSRIMDRRPIGFARLAAVLAERGYHGVTESELRDYVGKAARLCPLLCPGFWSRR